jgi:hypothetical protein
LANAAGALAALVVHAVQESARAQLGLVEGGKRDGANFLFALASCGQR